FCRISCAGCRCLSGSIPLSAAYLTCLLSCIIYRWLHFSCSCPCSRWTKGGITDEASSLPSANQTDREEPARIPGRLLFPDGDRNRPGHPDPGEYTGFRAAGLPDTL